MVFRMMQGVALIAVMGTGAAASETDGSLFPAGPVRVASAAALQPGAVQGGALSHLGTFLHKALAGGVSKDGMAVKVALPVGQDGGTAVEAIWVGPFLRRDDGVFLGTLAVDPREATGFEAGDLVEFTEDMIRDWMFVGDDGRIYGSYTTRLMLDDAGTAGTGRLRAMLAPSPLPADWR